MTTSTAIGPPNVAARVVDRDLFSIRAATKSPRFAAPTRGVLRSATPEGREACEMQDGAAHERSTARDRPRFRARRHLARASQTRSAHAAVRAASEDFMTILASATALGVAVYLLIALLQPERFS
jgi:K+-transporting ATPase KdpF subunit